MSFAVVTFVEKNEIAVIPVEWIKGDIGFWPPSKDVTRLVISRKLPEPEWKSYKVKISQLYGKNFCLKNK